MGAWRATGALAKLDGGAEAVQTQAMRSIPFAVVIVAWLSAAGAARPAPPSSATGDSLEAFTRALDSHDSATQVLGDWCAEHRMADPPVIRAVRDRQVDKPAGPAVRRLLRAGPGEPIRYRRVVLTCGDHALSEADNWYRPGLLTNAMNDRLDHTDAPFGAVVRPLDFHRVRLAPAPVAEGLKSPGAPRPVAVRRALLVTPAGAPFSLVAETYSAEIFAFARTRFTPPPGAEAGAGRPPGPRPSGR